LTAPVRSHVPFVREAKRGSSKGHEAFHAMRRRSCGSITVRPCRISACLCRRSEWRFASATAFQGFLLPSSCQSGMRCGDRPTITRPSLRPSIIVLRSASPTISYERGPSFCRGSTWSTTGTVRTTSRRFTAASWRSYPRRSTLCGWNRSENPWKRRQSLLALLYYSRSRRSVLSAAKVFPLIERLVDDEDRFVRKALGWTLREALAPYPAETAAFIEEYATRLSAIAFTEAASKLPPDVRERLKTLRAARRKRRAASPQ